VPYAPLHGIRTRAELRVGLTASGRQRWTKGLAGGSLGLLYAVSADEGTRWPLDKDILFAATFPIVGFGIGFTFRDHVLEKILRFLDWVS